LPISVQGRFLRPKLKLWFTKTWELFSTSIDSSIGPVSTILCLANSYWVAEEGLMSMVERLITWVWR
jgi:hypothetical protein